MEPGTGIPAIRLTLDAAAPGLSEEDFQRLAKVAKEGCPVSQALAGVKDISLTATLQVWPATPSYTGGPRAPFRDRPA